MKMLESKLEWKTTAMPGFDVGEALTMQIVNQHYSLMRCVQDFFPEKGPSDTKIQVGRLLHAACTWNMETGIP